MSTGWDADKFRLWAEVEIDPTDRREVDLIRFSARFPLNDVPKASLTVALGRKVRDNTVSPIHGLLSQLKLRRKVRVYCEAKTLGFFGQFGFNFWPADKFLVFEGYTTGAGYQRSPTSADYTLELEHWLSDLGFASAVSAVSSPLNPGAMTFSALTASPAESGGGAATTGGYTGLTHAEEFVTGATIASDFWGDAVQPFFLAMTELEEFVHTDAALQTGIDLGPLPAGNRPARSALKRIEPGVFVGEEYTYGKPLRFDPAAYGGDLDEVADQIEIAMGAETLEVMAGTTLWDKLVQYAGTYLFAVAPMVERALVIPFVPGLRTPFATISAREYDFVRLGGDMPRVLRGVGVYGGKNFASGGNLDGDGGVDYDQFAVGGYYQGAKTGQVLFKQCPMWMSTLNLSSEVARATGGDGLPRGDALNPGEGQPPEGAKPKAKVEANARLMNKYAETLYVYEVLKFRSGDMSGKFRLDIGPGSVVKIEGCGEKFLGVDDQFGQTLFATVLQVDLFLDAEAPRAGTAFHLAHVRNELENKTDGFSVARHPLWDAVWTGAPLQDLQT